MIQFKLESNYYSDLTRYLGPELVYQWNFGALVPGQPFNDNVAPLANGNTQNFTITNIRSENQGTYRLKATHPQIEDYVMEDSQSKYLRQNRYFWGS